MSQKSQQRKKSDRTYLILIFVVFAIFIVVMHASTQNNTESFFRKKDVRTVTKSTTSYKQPLDILGKATSKIKKGPFFYVFIVLDDAGAADEQLHPFYAFPEFEKLTFAVLPHLIDTQSVVHALEARNASYILHMPMQPLGLEDPGPFALRENYSMQKITELTMKNIQNIPNIIGVNNHMGSAATANETLMYTMLTYIKKKNLFFMDSRTSGKSVALEIASRVKIPFITRDIFLDNQENVYYITKQLQKTVTLARNRGFAVAIGHVTKSETAQALISAYQTMKAQGVLFASLREYFSYVR